MSLTASIESERRSARGELPVTPASMGDACLWQNLGRMDYDAAWRLQLDHVERVKAGGADRLLFVEHPHAVTFGRNGHAENLLVSRQRLTELGVAYHETDRGGDVTYHGPGQIVGYPILDLKRWKRDVGAYMRALEEVLILTLADYGLEGERAKGATGVWVGGAKVAAIGVHISRWVSSHGFALNVTTDLAYFGYIVPCGLAKPVTSLETLLGRAPERQEIQAALSRRFGEVFHREMRPEEDHS